MTDTQPGSPSAGALLRAAREKQGLHIAALAAAIKVAPRKLDALENDRWQDLPDATFTRALAQTVCRTLKIDARPFWPCCLWLRRCRWSHWVTG
jgi:cytoskeleton protein RodZ